MIRAIFAGFVFSALLVLAGCDASGQQAASSDEWFIKQRESFDRQHADFITRDAQSVRDYQEYMNQQP